MGGLYDARAPAVPDSLSPIDHVASAILVPISVVPTTMHHCRQGADLIVREQPARSLERVVHIRSLGGDGTRRDGALESDRWTHSPWIQLTGQLMVCRKCGGVGGVVVGVCVWVGV